MLRKLCYLLDNPSLLIYPAFMLAAPTRAALLPMGYFGLVEICRCSGSRSNFPCIKITELFMLWIISVIDSSSIISGSSMPRKYWKQKLTSHQSFSQAWKAHFSLRKMAEFSSPTVVVRGCESGSWDIPDGMLFKFVSIMQHQGVVYKYMTVVTAWSLKYIWVNHWHILPVV